MTARTSAVVVSGHTALNLGSGFGARKDSRFTFKSRFSRRRHVFYAGR